MRRVVDPRRWEAIRIIFDEVVELEAPARANRLAAIGVADPELRGAVESLLSADANADARLAPVESPLLPPAPATGSDTPQSTPDSFGLSGQTVSHFRVLAPIGAGGMGMVYRAEDTRLGRDVALKFLLPHYSLDASAKARFLHEARSAAALDHPNLCTIHEVGESEDGRLFLAMALYAGETLEQRLAREGGFGVQEALEIARQIAEGLNKAHGAGIVHRDLKPGNVMLLPDGTVKILDFGLAKVRDLSLTGSGIQLGTLAYMAPEQVLGESVDGRTDLWALGVVLYEMLTGRRPFAGDHELSVAHAIVNREPARPSSIRADLPGAVEDVVLALLVKEPSRRFADTAAVLDALTTLRTIDEPALLRSRPLSRRMKRVSEWLRRRSSQTILGGLTLGRAVVVGVFIAVAGAMLLLSRRGGEDAGAPSRVVVMPFENRTGDRDLNALGVMAADWVTQGLIGATFLTVHDVRTALATAQALGRAATPAAVGRQTGASVVIAGSYFLQGDSLRFQAQIISTADGSILVGIRGVTTPRSRPLEGIEQLRQRSLAALASLHDKEVTAFQTQLAQPPTYDAYREYTEGLEAYLRNEWDNAGPHFLRAAALDSSFLAARLWAVLSWVAVDNARADSLLEGLRLLKHKLSPYDRARFHFVVTQRGQDFREAYSAALRMVDAAPGSLDARREAALSAMRVFRPREALKRLRELDPASGLLAAWGDYWSAVAWSHHMLGEHQQELAAARRGRRLYPSNEHFRFLELRALASQGRVAEVDSVARAAFAAAPGQIGILGRVIAGELLAHDHAEPARRLARYAGELLAARPPPQQASPEWLQQHRQLTDLAGPRERFFANRRERTPADSASTWEQAKDEWLHQRAELALLLGDREAAANLTAQLRDPDAHHLLPARVAGAQGRLEDARAALVRGEGRYLRHWGTLRGMALDRAGALVGMGDREGALAILADGLSRGLIYDSQWSNDGHARPDLAPLWSDPRFKALIKPRG